MVYLHNGVLFRYKKNTIMSSDGHREPVRQKQVFHVFPSYIDTEKNYPEGRRESGRETEATCFISFTSIHDLVQMTSSDDFISSSTSVLYFHLGVNSKF